ncbi:MAG: flagellar assembly protein FliH, partial [Gemmatimonadetes bacterium]|nr:flagellar assembly protein FliH [Gemmatimonadota bacterium]NIT68620.1 flagellar assembly protein FliH [Gemmatimonadota bacterium]NIW77336.1 flagellar assembly protein FliH [Gemmatimonadota bacterium]NIY37197.1 flagellar assembly protein FliH [Gemmatimonadota bacterium]
EETKQAIAQRADLALEVIAERLQTVERTHAEAQTLAQEAAARLALTIARKVLPELSRQNALTEIEGLVRECLTELQDEPRVVVRVHDAMLDPLRQRLDRVTSATGYTGKVVLLTSQTLDEIDCRVEWADGGAERNTEGLWQEIDRVIERTLKAGGMASVAAPEKQE